IPPWKRSPWKLNAKDIREYSLCHEFGLNVCKDRVLGVNSQRWHKEIFVWINKWAAESKKSDSNDDTLIFETSQVRIN
ncbi:hypothetical protein BGZ65_004346, partial [Modicella reniformis]